MVLRKQLVVVGDGMVGHRLLEQLIERGLTARWNILAFCEEPRPAYDRVNLSQFFIGSSADALSLLSAPDSYLRHGVEVRIGPAISSAPTPSRARSAIDERLSAGACTLGAVRADSRAGTSCGSCRPEVQQLIRVRAALAASKRVVHGAAANVTAGRAVRSG